MITGGGPRRIAPRGRPCGLLMASTLTPYRRSMLSPSIYATAFLPYSVAMSPISPVAVLAIMTVLLRRFLAASILGILALPYRHV